MVIPLGFVVGLPCWETDTLSRVTSCDPVTSIPSALLWGSKARWEIVTSCTPSRVSGTPDGGSRSGIIPPGGTTPVNVIGAVGVPERVTTTGWAYSATMPLSPSMSTVCPAATTLAAAWIVQNGSAWVPGPESLHVGAYCSTYKVAAAVLPGCDAMPACA
jgi:hypothetical protein